MKLIKIFGINVKLIEEVESYSFLRWMNDKIKTQLSSEICTYNVPEVLNVRVNES